MRNGTGEPNFGSIKSPIPPIVVGAPLQGQISIARYRLTIYDAASPELARGSDPSFAIIDRKLETAAREARKPDS
jgi:hypothetical protein